MSEAKPPIQKILILGAAGGLAQITARLLKKRYHEAKILGIDSRPIKHPLPLEDAKFEQMYYSRGNFEKLFREHKFDIVLHLGRITHAISNPEQNLARRLDLNVMGTSRVLELCLKHKVRQIIIMSTYHVYGAQADNPVFISEDANLRASFKYSELRDVVEMDQLSTNWMWKNQNEVHTVVLRPCNVIGAQIKNAMCRYLTTPYSPTPIDYDPMFQFIHEYDMANVLVHCVEDVPTGIYNVAPDDFISLKEARKVVGVEGIPTSMFLLGSLAHLIKKAGRSLPDYLLDYLMFSCMLDGSRLRDYLGKDFFRFSTKDALELLKNA